MKDIIIKKFPHMLHGGDYNPDQWQDRPDILAEDMRLMQLADCNEMSVAIFAWAALEPEEGRFDFTFLDKAMDDIYAAGGRVLLATPSGARPVWMAEKYPEVLRTYAGFDKAHFGGRHNHCFTSHIYREKVKIINTKLAERYKDHPALIGWHISNEYGGECFCPMCQEAFRTWLKKKYGTIEKLNHEWWTPFWAHTYTDFSQIEPPTGKTDYSVHGRNIDWKRFVSDQTIDFMRAEIAPLKEITPDIPVTTNLMGFFPTIDYREMAKYLDFVSWDNYPTWKNDEPKDIELSVWTGLIGDLNRSLKKRPFLLMESTPSLVNWHDTNKLKRPHMHELASLQVVAHGSDSVQYFQWRKSRGSAEKFHGAVVDHCGHENTRVFRDVAALGARLKKLDDIVGTMPQVKVAIIHDWDNRWAMEGAQFIANKDKKLFDTLTDYYKPLFKRGIDTDIIGRDDDFSQYELIISPTLYMVPNYLEKKLCEYVKNGGTLVSSYLLGMVNENDLCHLGGWPCGELKNVFGIWNEEIDTLYPDESQTVKLTDGTAYSAVDFCELIHAQGAEVAATYDTDFYKGYPAVTVNKYGEGTAYYVTFRDNGVYTDRLIGEIVNKLGIKSQFDGAIPDGVSVTSRSGDGETYVFFQNFNHSDIALKTDLSWINVESGETCNGEIPLNPLEVKILKMA